MKIEKRRQFIINVLYFAIILGIVILLARYALGLLMPFFIALLVSLLLKPAVTFFHEKVKLPRSVTGVILVALFYLLMDWDRFVARLLALVPPHFRAPVDSFTDEADAVLGQYLRGQLLVMLAMAVFYAVGLALFGLDLALPIGVFTGLAMCIPYVGFGIGLLLALLAGLLEFASLKAVVMVAVVYGLGQLVESLFLTPRLVGERIGLHPLAVIFALLAFGQMFGFVGVLIALPASAVLLVAIRRLQLSYMSSQLYNQKP